MESTSCPGQHDAAPDGEYPPNVGCRPHGCGLSAGSGPGGGGGGDSIGTVGAGGSGIAAPGIRGSGTEGAGPGTTESPFRPVYADTAGGISGGPGFGPSPPGARRGSA